MIVLEESTNLDVFPQVLFLIIHTPLELLYDVQHAEVVLPVSLHNT